MKEPVDPMVKRRKGAKREKVKCLAPLHAITPVVQIAELGRIFITGSVFLHSFGTTRIVADRARAPIIGSR